MSLSLTQELKQTFHLHALRRQANMALTGRQWGKHTALKNRCEKARRDERRLFDERYETRIRQEYKKLLHEQNGKVKEFKPRWAQHDNFNKKALLAQSDTNVRGRHESRLQRIDRYEARELETLLQSSVRANQLTGKSKQAFNKSVDRRSGAERRSGHHIKQSRSGQRQSR